MKLSLINENISKKDFFDFYALLHAATDGNHPKEKEISQRLKFLVDTIYNDHLDQLSSIILSRISDTDFEPTVELLNKYGITWDEDWNFIGMDKLSVRDRLNIIPQIIKQQPYFGFTGDTWYKLADDITNIGTASSFRDKILAIDRIYNLLHHGGLITDYMDERNWIEDALNFRDNANPNQILGQSSSDIRSLIGPSSYHGESRTVVSDIDKLHTAFRRVIRNKNGIIVKKEDNILSITDKSKNGTVRIEDVGNKFNISNDKNNVDIPKPVRSYHNLADDLILQASKSDQPMRIGIGISNIKSEY